MQKSTSDKLVVGVDVDEVLANLHQPWISWGNARFGTSHTEFTHWDDPEDWWGQAAFEFLQPEIYTSDLVLPIDGAKDAVDDLRRQGSKILFVTSCGKNHEIEDAKMLWLARHGFLKYIDEFYPRVDKSSAPAHVLADDGHHNVKTFNGMGILIDAAHNKNEYWEPRLTHISALPDFLEEEVLPRWR